jgi:pyruvate dehydrogenase (quinone)
VPPLPPHITFEQARNLASALAHGEPSTAGVIKGTARQLAAAILPGASGKH